MSTLSPDFMAFFKELAKNNNKDWFDENRKRYEQSVKKPWYTLVDGLIERIRAVDPEYSVQAKDVVTRINRDIRFSKDKTIYKTNVGAMITPGGRKDKATPGLYVEVGPAEVRIYGGTHAPEKDRLYSLRNHIANNLDEFDQLMKDPGFAGKYKMGVQGGAHKRLPEEFREAAEKQPMMFFKSFYYYAVLEAELATQDNFIDILDEHYRAGKPMKDFLSQGLAS